MTEQLARNYTNEDVELALHTLALNGNSTKRAHLDLKAAGHTFPESTIKYWRTKHAERFQAIRQANEHTAIARMAQRAEDLAAASYEAQELAVLHTRVALENHEVRDPASTAANLAKVAESASRQAALLRGQPTERVEIRNIDEILKSLASKLPPNTVIDSTAEDIT